MEQDNVWGQYMSFSCMSSRYITVKIISNFELRPLFWIIFISISVDYRIIQDMLLHRHISVLWQKHSKDSTLITNEWIFETTHVIYFSCNKYHTNIWQITQENWVGFEYGVLFLLHKLAKRSSERKDQSAWHIVGTQWSFASSSSPTQFSSWKQNPGCSGFHHFQMHALPTTCRARHVDVTKPGISGGKSAVRWTHWILRSCFHVNLLSHEMWGKRKYNVSHK